MNITVTNSGSKHRWLRLNNGDYVGIAPGKSRDIDESAIGGNAAFQKLKDRRELAVSDIHVGAPKAAPKSSGKHSAGRKRAPAKKARAKAKKAGAGRRRTS